MTAWKKVGCRVEWRCEVPWRDCAECGVRFAHPTAKRCSDECRKARERRRYQETFVSVAFTNPEVHHTCPECGDDFVTRRYSAVRKFCSYRCSKRVSKRIRRHALRSRPYEHVGRWEIGQRDGWICQLCRKVVDPNGGERSRMGPTLDHIVPVAAGGCHLRSNLQIAHRWCNSKKGAGAAQLPMMLETAA